MSYWTESPSSEASFISLTLGSLASDDLRDLEELGLLPEEALADAQNDKEIIEKVVPETRLNGIETEGLPWFETLVEGSRLGNIRRQGERREGKGWKVEWEIMEWTEGDEDAPGISAGGKRKLDDRMADEDVGMD